MSKIKSLLSTYSGRIYVYLADGKTRTIENPKKKKKKHIQPVKTGIDEALAEKIRSEQTIYNEEIKFAIKIRAK